MSIKHLKNFFSNFCTIIHNVNTNLFYFWLFTFNYKSIEIVENNNYNILDFVPIISMD